MRPTFGEDAHRDVVILMIYTLSWGMEPGEVFIKCLLHMRGERLATLRSSKCFGFRTGSLTGQVNLRRQPDLINRKLERLFVDSSAAGFPPTSRAHPFLSSFDPLRSRQFFVKSANCATIVSARK